MPRRADRPRRPLPPGFGTIWSTVALDLLGFGIVLPILTIYGERFGASPTTLGLLVASFSVAQFVFAPLLGRLSDRIGRKPVILISLFGTAAGSLLTGAATAVWMLFLGRIVDGASGASVSVAQGAVTDVAAPAERTRLLGLLGAAFGIGFVFGPALGGLAALAGPRVPFYVAAAIAFVNAIVAIRRLPETRPVGRARARPPAAAAAADGAVAAGPTTAADAEAAAGGIESESERVDRRRALATFALVTFVATSAFAAFEATFALFGQRRFDLTEGSVAPVFVGIGLLLVFVQGGLIHPMTARFGDLGTLRLGLTLNAVGLLLLAATHNWALLAVALALLVFGQGLATPTISALVANRAHDDRRGGALGFQQSAGSLARIAGPALGGVLFQHAGVPVPYIVGAGLVAVALAALAVPRIAAASRPSAPAARGPKAQSSGVR